MKLKFPKLLTYNSGNIWHGDELWETRLVFFMNILIKRQKITLIQSLSSDWD